MAAEITTLTIVTNQATNLTVATDVSIFNATSATINVGSSIDLSNATPSDISDVGSAGVSNLAARSDHVHSGANVILNGGNF